MCAICIHYLYTKSCKIQEWKNVIRLPREIPPYIGCTLSYGALKIYAAILEARPVLEVAVRARGFGNLLIIGGAGDASELWAVILMKHVFCDKNVKVWNIRSEVLLPL